MSASNRLAGRDCRKTLAALMALTLASRIAVLCATKDVDRLNMP